MTLKHFLLLFTTLLFIQCSQPAKNKDLNSDKSENLEIAEQSKITCPKCGHSKMESLPTDVCLISYNCEKCKTELVPQGDDCCVFCSYGTHKCPSKQ